MTDTARARPARGTGQGDMGSAPFIKWASWWHEGLCFLKASWAPCLLPRLHSLRKEQGLGEPKWVMLQRALRPQRCSQCVSGASNLPPPLGSRCWRRGTYVRCSTRRSSRAGRPGCRPPRRRSARSGRRGACRDGSSSRRSSSRCRPPGRSSAAGSGSCSARPPTSPRPPTATAGSTSGWWASPRRAAGSLRESGPVSAAAVHHTPPATETAGINLPYPGGGEWSRPLDPI